MSKLAVLFFSLIVFCAATPQAQAPDGFNIWSAASLRQTTERLAQQVSSDPHHVALQQLADFPNDTAILVHREADGSPEWHETQVDVVFVQSGSATLLVGGTLVNAQTVAPHEQRNGTIQGGFRQKVAAGDLLRIPAKAPHQFLLEGAKEITYLVIKVKGY